MRRTLLLVLALLAGAPVARAQTQVEDTTWVPRVAKPAFSKTHPVVLIDESHNNLFTTRGMYRGFAALLRDDGLTVFPSKQAFSAALLKTATVLVVADASPTRNYNGTDAREPAFRREECDAVRDWVRDGGALLLIADHAPFGSAMDSLGARFGVDMGKSRTVDTRRVDRETGNIACVAFTREHKTIGEHPITRGRDRSERIQRVVVFGGQSLEGPPGSAKLLVLGPSALDLPISPDSRREATPEQRKRADPDAEVSTPGAVPAVGRAQGLAFDYGKGRVVVLGDGAMFGTQFALGNEAQRMGKERLAIGLNRPDLDNQQFALNVLHWLARLLD
jgi:hypothetical protein